MPFGTSVCPQESMVHIACPRPPGNSVCTTDSRPSVHTFCFCPLASFPRHHWQCFVQSLPHNRETWRVLATTSDVGNVTQGPGVPDHQVLPIGGARHSWAFRRWCFFLLVQRANGNGTYTRPQPRISIYCGAVKRRETIVADTNPGGSGWGVRTPAILDVGGGPPFFWCNPPPPPSLALLVCV